MTTQLQNRCELRALAREDLDAAVEVADRDVRAWQGARILITGATGFVGTWALAVLAHANQELDLDVELLALARRPAALPRALARAAHLVAGDVRTLDPREIGSVDAIIHLATAPNDPPGSVHHDPHLLSTTAIDGARSVLRLAARSGGSRVLVASSGAVHGKGDRRQRLAESDATALTPENASTVYGLSKLRAEGEAVRATNEGAADAVIARLWTFIGPLLPLDGYLAAGNFIADALAGRPILITGAPTSTRSYLYPIDMVAWLLAVLSRGGSAATYNVGSEIEIAIGDLAGRIARQAASSVCVGFSPSSCDDTPSSDYYVPDAKRARVELGVYQTISLDDAIERTLRWHRARVRTGLSISGDST